MASPQVLMTPLGPGFLLESAFSRRKREVVLHKSQPRLKTWVPWEPDSCSVPVKAGLLWLSAMDDSFGVFDIGICLQSYMHVSAGAQKAKIRPQIPWSWSYRHLLAP